ncbi:MobV family relaxase [Hymenobacter psychrophilus]|uniref:Plasmid recombination enzyme n=1 Tax=Hymenobacter psychrophilus TaxID=651662 RepID=A0A1H3PB72_9BACT|nr:MobV family relaxase [Hymenobacter psychrophilus]SDY98402.1 Plasmid recombination enzyme [Hymenobacter psychrophilus]
MLPFCILRHGKLTDEKHANKATTHNYRKYDVPNVDKEPRHPNIEFINTEERSYWDLATERIAEAGITIRRKDAIRCVELILTASPEFFERDEKGRAADQSDSQWVKDNRAYVEKKYGKENVIAFQLQQDETTPHCHVVIVPITADGRLSARDLINPVALRINQNDYHEAMAAHGLERGVERSQAVHQPMSAMYSKQNKTAAELGEKMGAASAFEDVPVKRPGAADLFKLTEWEAKSTASVSEQGQAQVEKANQRAEKGINLALENASAKSQVRALQSQLRTTEKLKEKHYREKIQAQGELKQAEQEKIKLAVILAQGQKVPADLLKLGAEQREKDRQETKKAFEVHLVNGAYTDYQSYMSGLKAQGFKFKTATEANPNQVAHPKHGSQFTYAEICPNGHEISEQVAEQLQARQARADAHAHEMKQAEIRQAEKARQQVATKELALMERAFDIYRWKPKPAELTACLVVPKEKADEVAKSLRRGIHSHAAHLGVQGEPSRRDGMQTVYVKYQPSFAHVVDSYFDNVRAMGGQVHEYDDMKARREGYETKPQVAPTIKRESGQSKGFGIGDD